MAPVYKEDKEDIQDALYDLSQLLTTSEVIEQLEVPVPLPTLIRWCNHYGIGKKVGGRWYVDPQKLNLLLQGESKAMRTFGNGRGVRANIHSYLSRDKAKDRQ